MEALGVLGHALQQRRTLQAQLSTSVVVIN